MGDELVASSTTCCSRVLQLGAARGFAGRALAHPLAQTPARHRPVPLGPAGRQEAAAGSTAARGRCAAGESGEVAGRRAQRGRPLRWGRAPDSLLLANANTALFFRDRASAPGTGAATRGAPAKRSASSGKARRSPSRRHPGRFSRRPATRGAPRGPQGSRRAAEAANAPATTCGPLARRTRSREIPDSHSRQRPRWRGQVAGSRSPPAAAATSGRPRAGNFPCLDSGQADPQPSGGGRGAALGWRETREACSSRAGDLPAERGQAGERTRRWGCPGDPRRRKLRGMENRSEGRAGTEGAKAKPGDTGGSASSRDKSEFRRVRKVRGASEGSPSPHALAPGPEPTPLSTPRYARRRGVGAAIPEGAHPQPPGRREGAPTPRPLPSQPRLSLPRSRRFGFRKWGEVVMETSPLP